MIRNLYEKHGVTSYYEQHGDIYRNPHESTVRELIKQAEVGTRVLDLCCGSGEITLALDGCDVTGSDPYTSKAYYERTGKLCLPYSFMDIAQGKLEGRYDSVTCSFALHLCPESLLPMVLYHLSIISNKLIVLTPHKRPDCDGISGWTLVDQVIHNRVRMNTYIGRIKEEYGGR